MLLVHNAFERATGMRAMGAGKYIESSLCSILKSSLVEARVAVEVEDDQDSPIA